MKKKTKKKPFDYEKYYDDNQDFIDNEIMFMLETLCPKHQSIPCDIETIGEIRDIAFSWIEKKNKNI